jgi:peroxiredoxin
MVILINSFELISELSLVNLIIYRINKMRQKIILIAVLINFLSCNQGRKADDKGYIVNVGEPAPDFVINEAGGKSYRLKDLKGKVVMLQFTASWCSVCRTEMPFIEKEIWQEMKDSALIVIGIDRDEPIETVLDFQKDMAITYPLALDPGAGIFGLYAHKESGVTRNVIIDRTGKIIFLSRLYYRKEFDQMKKYIFSEISSK